MSRFGRSCSEQLSENHPSVRLSQVICLKVEKQMLQSGLSASMETSEWITGLGQDRRSVGARPWQLTNGIDRLRDMGADWMASLSHSPPFFASLWESIQACMLTPWAWESGVLQPLSWVLHCHPLMWFPTLQPPFTFTLSVFFCLRRRKLFRWLQLSALRCLKMCLCSSLNNTKVSNLEWLWSEPASGNNLKMQSFMDVSRQKLTSGCQLVTHSWEA